MFPLADTTKEHLSFAVALGMRTFVVITKIDMCQEHTTKKVLEEVEKLLSFYKKTSTVVKNVEGVITTAQNFLNDKCVYLMLVHTFVYILYVLSSF